MLCLEIFSICSIQDSIPDLKVFPTGCKGSSTMRKFMINHIANAGHAHFES